MLRHISPAFVIGLVLFGSLACKEEEPSVLAKDYPMAMAEGYCDAVFKCPCADYPYPTYNDCWVELSSAYDELNDAAFLANLQYDSSCPAKELESVDELACKVWVPEIPASACAAPCNVWHGPLPAGTQCESIASSDELGIEFSACAQGLDCIGGLCLNPCLFNDVPGLGEACPELICDIGAMCDPATSTCVPIPPLPGPGAACENGLCNPETAICIVNANVCAVLPGVGQMCVEGVCDRDTYCDDNICIPRPALACALL